MQPFTSDSLTFDPTTPEPVIINGAPPVAPAPKRKWLVWTGAAVLGLVLTGGWISSAMEASSAQDKLAVVEDARDRAQSMAAGAEKRLDTSKLANDDLKSDLLDAASALSEAGTYFEKSAGVADSSCDLIDAMFDLVPAMTKGDTINLCKGHANQLRGWAGDANTASGAAASAGR